MVTNTWSFFLYDILAAEVVNAIKASKDVQALCLEGNTIGVEAAEAIGGALAARPEFEVIIHSYIDVKNQK